MSRHALMLLLIIMLDIHLTLSVLLCFIYQISNDFHLMAIKQMFISLIHSHSHFHIYVENIYHKLVVTVWPSHPTIYPIGINKKRFIYYKVTCLFSCIQSSISISLLHLFLYYILILIIHIISYPRMLQFFLITDIFFLYTNLIL